MRILMRSALAGAAAIALATSGAANAQEVDNDTEESFDEALNQFGYAAGATHQCSTETEKEDVLRKVQHVYNRLAQLFGTDRAFFFSASFGAGSVDQIEPDSCDAYKAGFRDALAAHEGLPGAKQ